MSRTVLVHAGICDASMWDGFELPGELVAHSLPAPLEESVGDGPAALVGVSFGALVSLELAARRPELVEALVLLSPPLSDHDWSDEVTRYAEEEERLLDAGELEAATDLNVAFWAPGLGESIRPAVRASLERDDEEVGVVDLSAVRAPALVAVGEHDRHDFHAIAERLERELPGAERALIAGAGHLAPLEQPERTAALVREFLERARPGP